MSNGVSSLRIAAWLFGVLVCHAFLLNVDCAAQGGARKGGLPRVGTIKDYPATGQMVGCGNIYSHPPQQARAVDPPLVFIARSDGSNAWMNLGGRDVRLRQIKSAPRAARNARSFNYLHEGLRISVLFEDLKPGEPLAEADFMFSLRITLRRGRAARTVRAVGYADC